MKLFALAAFFLTQLPSTRETRSVARQEAAGTGSELVLLWSAGIDALLVDGRDKGLATALGMLDERLVELGRDLEDPSFPADAVRLAHGLLTGPACLRVERVDSPRAGAPPARAQLACRAPDAEAAQRNVEQLAALAMRAGVPLQRSSGGARLSAPTPLGPLVLEAQADALVLALGEPRKETFAFETRLPAGVAPALHARWNGRGIGELLEPFVLAGGPGAERAWSLMELLGVVGKSAPTRTWSLGLASDHALVHSVVSGWAALGDGSVVPPLDPADFARVPADATFVRLFQLRPRMLLALAEVLEAGAGQRAGETLHPLLGADLGELLDLFGPSAGVFASLSTGGGGLASGVAFLDVTDAARVEALLERLAGLVDAAARGPAQGRVAVRTWEHAGARARTLAFPGLPVPFELSLAVHADALLVALHPRALIAALEVQASGRSLLDHPRLAPLVSEWPEDAVSFGFLDAPLWLDRGYGNACAVSAALANALRSPYAPAREPGSLLPSFAALRRGARPSVSWSRLVGDDLVGTTSFDRSFVANATVMLGTPVSSLYFSGAGLGIVSSIAIPKLMSARVAANESAAIANLLAITSAQAAFVEQREIDEDRDGRGEYGFLGELAGARVLRGQRERIAPPMLTETFGVLQDDGDGDGVLQRSGYWFQVWLPARSGTAVAEPASPAAAVQVHPDAAERAWCAYAWPVEPGSTGQRVFFINQEGEVLAFDNPGGIFGGLAGAGGRQPNFDSALTRPDLEAATARSRRSADGTVWHALD